MEIKEFSGDFLQWMRGFHHLARTRSFSKAAAEIHRNQGTLTYQIKKLEEELQVNLVDRKVSPIQLTPKGELLHEISLEVFNLLNRIYTEVSDSGNYSGEVNILCNYGLSSQYLPEYLQKFKEQYPEIKVFVTPEKNTNVIYRMTEPEIDFVITRDDFLEDQCNFYPLFKSPLALVVPKTMKLSPKPTLEEMAKLPYITISPAGDIDKEIADLFEKEGHTIHSVINEGYFLATLKYVELGMGAAILDSFLAKTRGYKIKIHDLSHLVKPQVYGIAVKNNQYISPQAQQLINFLQAECK